MYNYIDRVEDNSITYLLMMTYIAKPQHKTPSPDSNEITILADPSLVIIALYLILLIHALLQTRMRQEILHVHYMTMHQHKNPCPGGHEIYKILVDPLGRYYYTLTLSDLCLVVKKILKK